MLWKGVSVCVLFVREFVSCTSWFYENLVWRSSEEYYCFDCSHIIFFWILLIEALMVDGSLRLHTWSDPCKIIGATYLFMHNNSTVKFIRASQIMLCVSIVQAVVQQSYMIDAFHFNYYYTLSIIAHQLYISFVLLYFCWLLHISSQLFNNNWMHTSYWC